MQINNIAKRKTVEINKTEAKILQISNFQFERTFSVMQLWVGRERRPGGDPDMGLSDTIGV